MSDNSGIQEIIMYRSRAWRALKIGTLIGVGGFIILSVLILKYSDAQDVFPQIRFVGIICAVVLFYCGFAAWDNFQVARKLRKELGECADFAQRYKEGCARTEYELLKLQFKEEAFLAILLMILCGSTDPHTMPFIVWLTLEVSYLLCAVGVGIFMSKDCRMLDELDEMHNSPESKGLR